MVEKQIMEDLGQPRFQMGASRKLFVGTKCTCVGLLHEILSFVWLFHQMEGNTVEMVEMQHRLSGELFPCILLIPPSHVTIQSGSAQPRNDKTVRERFSSRVLPADDSETGHFAGTIGHVSRYNKKNN